MSRLFHILLAACCLMISCSDTRVSDDVVSEGPYPSGSKAVLTVTFLLPGQVDEARVCTADPRTPGMLPPDRIVGTEEENRVSSACVILGEIAQGANIPLKIHSVHELKDLHMTGNNSQWTGRIAVVPGHYRVIVIANLDPEIRKYVKFASGDDWNKFVQQEVYLPMDKSEMADCLWRDNHFLMSNAFHERIEEYDVKLELGKENFATIRVQRVCARLDYRTQNPDNVYTTKLSVDNDGSTGTLLPLNIRLTDMALMNVSRGFYLIKQISPDEMGNSINHHVHENNQNYVADVDWGIKRMFYYNVFSPERLHEYFYYSSECHAPLAYKPLPAAAMAEGEYLRMGYVTENTIPGLHKQVNMLSTGVVFKGVFSCPEQITSENLYFFQLDNDHKFLFTSYEALCRFMDKMENVTLPPVGEVNDDILAGYSVKRFERDAEGNYPVWYTYWNRHRDNRNPLQMGIMEFATVRNNIYRLQVTRISTLGLPKDPVDENNPWKPDGQTPDELGLELEVNLKVSDWVVRDFVHEI